MTDSDFASSIVEEEGAQHEPHIICSLGLFPGGGE
jgi:hypothetical protein